MTKQTISRYILRQFGHNPAWYLCDTSEKDETKSIVCQISPLAGDNIVGKLNVSERDQDTIKALVEACRLAHKRLSAFIASPTVWQGMKQELTAEVQAIEMALRFVKGDQR